MKNLPPPSMHSPAAATSSTTINHIKKKSKKRKIMPTNSSNNDGPSSLANNAGPSNFSPAALIRKMFKVYGEFAASQPFETIVVVTFVLLLAVSGIYLKVRPEKEHSMAASCSANKQICQDHDGDVHYNEDMIWKQFLANLCIAFSGFLRLAHQGKKIYGIGSNLLCVIATAYTIIATCFVGVGLWALGNIPWWHSCFLLPLLIDMAKVRRMAQFTLSSSHSRRISENVANGMYVLGPSLTFDTLIWFLFFSLGLYTGFDELQAYTVDALATLTVNWIIFIFFYPPGLCVILELFCVTEGRPRWNVKEIIRTLPNEDGQSSNIHRLKVTATGFFFMVHVWFSNRFLEALWIKALVVVGIVLVLVKFLLFEDLDEARELRRTYIDEMKKQFKDEEESQPANVEEVKKEERSANNGNKEVDQASNTTDDTGISMSAGSSKQRTNDDSGSESAWSEVNYLPDLKANHNHSLSTSSSVSTGSSCGDPDADAANVRSIEECR